MQAGGPVHDPLVSLPAGDPGAEADRPGAGGCEQVQVRVFVFGGMLKIVCYAASMKYLASIHCPLLFFGLCIS